MRRNEPRNIGVIVWTSFGIEAKFWGEKRACEITKRRAPPFVFNLDIYRQWVRYWRAAIGKPRFKPPTGGPPVPTSSPEFLDALKLSGRDEYFLTDGGFLLDPIGVEDMAVVAQQLFEMLVDAPVIAEEPKDLDLDDLWDQAVEEAPPSDRAEMRSMSGWRVPNDR
jgi:hypothetical protein